MLLKKENDLSKSIHGPDAYIQRWLSENEVGPEETFNDGGDDGEGWSPRMKPCCATARECSHLLQWCLATQETWGSSLYLTWSEISEFNCCQQAGIQ